MKYIITESQIDSLITKQLDIMFDVENINWTHPYGTGDDDYDHEDSERIEYYFGDYGDGDTIFYWYDKGYWGQNPDNYIGYTSKSPIVDIEEPYHSNLNALFGDKWYKPFKVWFEFNFEVPVKSVSDEVFNKSR
jgi:hypothetical protein